MKSRGRIIEILIVIALHISALNAVAFGRLLPPMGAADWTHLQNKPDAIVGSVIETNAAGKSAKIRTDSGEVVALKVDDNTTCVRIPAGEKSLSKAIAIQFAEVAVGDRVLAHGQKAGNEFLGQRLIVLTKSEIEKKRERDLEEWRQRGIGGIVRGVNAQTGEIDLELRGQGAGSRVSVASSAAQFRRYSPGSLSFEDAAPSNLSELKAGDQLRALGDKTSDGRSFKAETVVSGAFKTIGATVVEINLQANELKVVTLDKKEPLIISITKDTTVSRIPQPVAVTLAQKAAAASRPPASGPAPGTQRPAATQNIDVQQVIDSLPKISAADLKPGDVLAVTSAVEKDPSRLTAIKLVAGVDLVLKAMAPQPGRPQTIRLSAGLPSVFDFSVVQ
jgi:hypothetical protein